MDLCWESSVLLFNMLSRLVIIFLPRSKHLIISWLQSPSALILEPKKINAVTVSPFICHEVMALDPVHGDWAKIIIYFVIFSYSTLLLYEQSNEMSFCEMEAGD